MMLGSLLVQSLQARSLDIPADRHINRLPLSGVLTRIGEPSDAAPEGSNGKHVLITMAAARKALDSLLGMGINYNPEGHAKEKIGVITGAEIQGNAIHINGFLYAADFPEAMNQIRATAEKLGFSFEAKDLLTPDPDADPISFEQIVFTGASILLRDNAAFRTTFLALD